MKKGCTRKAWIDAARLEAEAAGVCLEDLLNGVRDRPVTAARWRAFRRILARNVSATSLGRISGFDRTTIRRTQVRDGVVPFANSGRRPPGGNVNFFRSATVDAEGRS